jgi:hypothetical protein
MTDETEKLPVTALVVSKRLATATLYGFRVWVVGKYNVWR